jgi:uncharacterized membrane protein YraQ (UPF0718 family)
MFPISFLLNTLAQVWTTFLHNWFYLLISILIATLLKLYLNSDTLSAWLKRYRRAGVLGATAAAVATPLCSCGTTAVLLGMMAGAMPWAPIVAFMVASPLTSPQELVYSAGLFGWKFAWAFFLASIFLGLLGGLIASAAEARGWLAGQSRVPAQSGLTLNVLTVKPAVTPRRFFGELLANGKTLLGLFFAFAFIGYLLNGLIPAAWLPALFGEGRAYGIPLAATLGLPFYINTEASLPLVRAMLDGGMSEGAALAFLITGAGTSFGAVAGALAIARWRVIAIVIGTLWLGAVTAGWLYNLLAF